MTLETIWSHFVAGGFRHDSAWQAFGPYLTLQLAHAFLFIGDVGRMDQLLGWAVGDAGYPRVSRDIPGLGTWNVALGCWNEQHDYPVASDFNFLPFDSWYMGDIPHGWAAAELLLLLRDILCFEADEDGQRHRLVAPGVMPHWVTDGRSVSVRDAPTLFGVPFGYVLTHHAAITPSRSVSSSDHRLMLASCIRVDSVGAWSAQPRMGTLSPSQAVTWCSRPAPLRRSSITTVLQKRPSVRENKLECRL